MVCSLFEEALCDAWSLLEDPECECSRPYTLFLWPCSQRLTVKVPEPSRKGLHLLCALRDSLATIPDVSDGQGAMNSTDSPHGIRLVSKQRAINEQQQLNQG